MPLIGTELFWALARAHMRGRDDARTFAAEHTTEELLGAANPHDQSGADEALINAHGREGAAKLFGVQADTEDFARVCRTYSKAWLREVRYIARSIAIRSARR